MRAPARLAVGALGAAGFAYYHAQVPTSQLYGATICRRPEAGRVIALTYDDGPNPDHTETLMEVLDSYGARATFFLIGKWAEGEPGLVRALAEAGHALGNHTYSHPTMPLRSAATIREELRRSRDAVERSGVGFSEVDGAALMRPPYGRRRPGTLRTMRAEGYVPVTWSITAWDWRPGMTPEKIARKCAKAGDGDVILLHDGGETGPTVDRSASVAATEQTLERFSEKGYRFVTIPELVAA